MDMDNSVVISGEEEGIWGLNGYGENTIKINF